MESETLIAAIRVSFFVRLTESSLAEIVATPDPAARKNLLDCMRLLCIEGDCIMPHQWIVRELVRSFTEQPSRDWRSVPTRFRECEAELARQEIVNDEIAAKQRFQAESLNKNFEGIYSKIAEELKPFLSSHRQRPTIRQFLQTGESNGGSLWTIAKIVHDGFALRSCDAAALHLFYERCPPFRALVKALAIAGYERCIRDIRKGPSYAAGRTDLLMATYLPYCHNFITADRKQATCLQLISAEGNLGTSIFYYRGFRKQILAI